MKPTYQFDGIERHGNYLSARYKIILGNETDSVAHAQICISVPISNHDERSCLQLERELHALALAGIQTQPFVDWIDRERQKT